MLYYAPQQSQHQHHPSHYDPSLAMPELQPLFTMDPHLVAEHQPLYYSMPPSLMPEHQPLYYTIDPHGNYILLTPPQNNLSSDSGPNENGGNSQNNYDQHGNYVVLTPQQVSGSVVNESNNSGNSHDGSYLLLTPRQNNLSSGSVGGSGKNKSRNSPAYKTMMCNMFSTNGSCSYGAGCQYAHGKEDIRPTVPHPKYKTQLCNKFNSPRGCQYGEKCHFRHPDDSDGKIPCELNFSSVSSDSHHRNSSNGNSGKKKNGTKGSLKSPTSSPMRASATSNEENGKKNEKNNKDSLIKLSMYHRFENYVGKNRKPTSLKRSNSSNTVGVFTLQRFVSMQEVVKNQLGAKQKQQIKDRNIKPKV